MRFSIIFLLPVLLFSLPGYHEPWGKDADLKYTESQPEPSPPSILGQMMLKVIYFHQTYITHVDGPRSHFKPSSSNYMKMAIEKHGFLKGYIMGCDRLMRENGDNWVYPTAIIDGKRWKIDPPE
ncbi:MAG: membrane protein insertion efficiency factor YidD [Verrucomicrobia bacterium]|nr:membrane protein insertion efficiency factor YidD [Verrucomicrobiota bacterium]